LTHIKSQSSHQETALKREIATLKEELANEKKQTQSFEGLFPPPSGNIPTKANSLILAISPQ